MLDVDRVRRELLRRVMSALARVWIRIKPRKASELRAQRAWLIGGSAGKVYGDNSAALHRYLRRTYPELPVYWVINRDSPDVASASANGPILFRNELNTYMRAHLAAVHVISHGVQDVPGCGSRSTGALKVRLGHGLTALKRTRPRTGHSNQSANAVFDLVPVCSDFERSHKLEWDIPPDRLVVTGIPRFDDLLVRQREHPTQPTRILYMPTWRDSLVSAADVTDTAFYRGLQGFLEHHDLHDLLDRHDATLDVYLHVNLAPYLGGFDARLEGSRVRQITMSDPQRLFAEASMLVTDYSSVAWDFLYLDKPVAFYHLEGDDYDQTRGGYLGADDGLPGPVAESPEEVVKVLDDHLSGALRADPSHRELMRKWQATAFAFRDERNAERVTAAIFEALGRRCRGLD